MERWGADLYGNPCRECGFGWELSPAQAIAWIRAAPDAYAGRLADATGRERHPDLLARARYYNEVSLAGALWSLRWAVDAWTQSAEVALAGGVVLRHATRGAQAAEDVARNNTHDAHHHLWDIDRTLARH